MIDDKNIWVLIYVMCKVSKSLRSTTIWLMIGIFGFWFMLYARCQKVIYLLNIFVHCIPRCDFSSRFVNQWGNEGAKGQLGTLHEMRGILFIWACGPLLCLYWVETHVYALLIMNLWISNTLVLVDGYYRLFMLWVCLIQNFLTPSCMLFDILLFV